MQIQTEQPKNGVDEHILVCLSSSPSNARIIHTAAKMAKVLHAKFTAIYVQTDSVESEKNRLRLEQNIQLAQGLGAEIVMTHGEDVPLQISEYVRLSDVTKIVIGQSSARRRDRAITTKLMMRFESIESWMLAPLFAVVLGITFDPCFKS